MMIKKTLSGLVALFAVALMSAGPSETGYKVGDTATDFSLKGVDGKMISMKGDAAAKGYILAFTCNECPYAKLYEDRIIALHQKYAAKGYPVIAINPNDPSIVPEDSYAEMQKRAKEKNIPYAYVLDETQQVAKTYGAQRTPHIYIVQRAKGDQFKVAYIGAVDDNAREPGKVTNRYAEQAIDALLTGKSIATTSTKAIGCGIKWKQS
jgi:peroxiredoxin